MAFLLLFTISLAGFCHEAQKQTKSLLAETLSQKWLECESADEGEYQKLLKDFEAEVKKAAPSVTVTYYFPEAKVIHENILEGIRDGDRQKIAENVLSWEILQKSLINFQLEQFYYSYGILIFVIIVVASLFLLFVVLYLVTSKLRKENQTYTREMIQMQETERERISNELHDTVCQDLRELQFQLKEEKSVVLCQKIASDVRDTCYALTPSDLREGLFEALVSLCEFLKKQSGVNIILFVQDELKNNQNFRNFSKEKNLNIYRIVQEILNNAVKHSGSESISVLVRTLDEKNFKIIVSDEGKGFDFKTALKKKKHFGLKNIQARSENIGGKTVFNSAAGEGTQVTVVVPL